MHQSTRRASKTSSVPSSRKHSHRHTSTTRSRAHTQRKLLSAQFSTQSSSTAATQSSSSRKKKQRNLTPSTNVREHISISDSPHGVLARDFIRESLYSKKGYFNSSRVINSPGVINFSELLGKSAYEKRLQTLYYAGVQGWTTPVEIFQPFYAQALARYFLSFMIPDFNKLSFLDESRVARLQKMTGVQLSLESTNKQGKQQQQQQQQQQENVQLTPNGDVHFIDQLDVPQDNLVRRFGTLPQSISHSKPVQPVHIVELGAGNGTAASNMLDFIQSFFPQVYHTMRYSILEMSESLSYQQRELLESTHPGKYVVHTVNAAEYQSEQQQQQQQQQQPSTQPQQSSQSEPIRVTKPMNKKQLSSKSVTDTLTASVKQKTDENQSIPTTPHHFIFGLEVLDNMVHDKVIQGSDGNWYQIYIASKHFIDTKLDPNASNTYSFGDISRKSSSQPSAASLALPPCDITAALSPFLDKSQFTVSDTKPNQFSLSSHALHSFITQKPLPIDYTKLNIRPDSSYIEYALPIVDPVIQQCLTMHLSFRNIQNQNHPNQDQHLIQTDLAINAPDGQNDILTTPRSSSGGGFISKIVKYVLNKKLTLDPSIVYLPTELLRTFHMINVNFPSHTLFLADFDMLPTTEKIRAVNAPVVAHKESDTTQRGKTKDEASYLVPLGLCDIFFPTDFRFVSYMYNSIILGHQSSTTSNNESNDTKLRSHLLPIEQASDIQQLRSMLQNPFSIAPTSLALSHDTFLRKFADLERTSCKNGFNPMLQDYTNMAIFIGQRDAAIHPQTQLSSNSTSKDVESEPIVEKVVE